MLLEGLIVFYFCALLPVKLLINVGFILGKTVSDFLILSYYIRSTYLVHQPINRNSILDTNEIIRFSGEILKLKINISSKSKTKMSEFLILSLGFVAINYYIGLAS